jgi:hypothetical protein
MQLAKAGKRLAETVVQGNGSYARRLANDYLKTYEDVT